MKWIEAWRKQESHLDIIYFFSNLYFFIHTKKQSFISHSQATAFEVMKPYLKTKRGEVGNIAMDESSMSCFRNITNRFTAYHIINFRLMK